MEPMAQGFQFNNSLTQICVAYFKRGNGCNE